MPWTGSDFSDRDVGEVPILTFDFSRPLAPGEQILTATATMTSVDGNDPSPASRLVGSPLINGAQVSQLVSFAGVVVTSSAPRNQYQLRVVITTSLNQVLDAFSGIGVSDPSLAV